MKSSTTESQNQDVERRPTHTSRASVAVAGAAPKKKKKTGDELRSVALQVNLYVIIPFVCELATAITETAHWNGEWANFIQTTSISAMGIITFFVFCFDSTLQRFNPKVFERLSLKLIACLVFACVGFHVSFLYSLFLSDDGNCRASTFLYLFFALVHSALTSGLG
ncbi:hypothetical protein HDU96_008048 [Phlyctochytrium bullatum]|nr:hypothetical protein HDU96_008048 [Phlyctochytrium bullatum]